MPDTQSLAGAFIRLPRTNSRPWRETLARRTSPARQRARHPDVDMTHTRYFQVLNTLIDRREAPEVDAALVGRLERLRMKRGSGDKPGGCPPAELRGSWGATWGSQPQDPTWMDWTATAQETP
jgi:hypothetical protein